MTGVPIGVVRFRSSGQDHRRRRRENLGLLRPGTGLTVSTLYRRRRVAPEDCVPNPGLAGGAAGLPLTVRLETPGGGGAPLSARVRFLPGTGRRAFFSALRELADTHGWQHGHGT